MSPRDARARIEGRLMGLVGHLAVGWAANRAELDRKLVITLEYDGECFCSVTAQSFDPSILAQGIGDGCHGFVIHLPQWIFAHAKQLRARVANTNIYLDGVIHLGENAKAKIARRLSKNAPPNPAYLEGAVHYDGFLRVSGWAFDRNAPEKLSALHIEVDGKALTEITADQFREDLRQHGIGDGCHGFVYWLPARYADATTHRVRVLDDCGKNLFGSPFEIFALPAGARQLIHQIERTFKSKGINVSTVSHELGLLKAAAREIDRRGPVDFSATDYPHWYGLFGVPEDSIIKKAAQKAKAVFGIDLTAREPGPRGQKTSGLAGSSKAPDAVLIARVSDSLSEIYSRMLIHKAKLLVLKHDTDVLLPHALVLLANAIIENRADAAYGYLDYLGFTQRGRKKSNAAVPPELQASRSAQDGLWRKPARPDLTRALCQDYLCDGLMVRRGALEALLKAGTVDPEQLHLLSGFDLPYLLSQVALCPWVTVRRRRLLRYSDHLKKQAALAAQRHLTRNYFGARIHLNPAHWQLRAVDWRCFAKTVRRVSLIIPMRDAAPMTRRAVLSALRLAGPLELELIVVDNQSQTQEAREFFKELLDKNFSDLVHAPVSGSADARQARLQANPRARQNPRVRLSGVRVLRYDKPFNYAAMMNQAVKASSGEVVALLNNDIEALTENWLTHMVGRLMALPTQSNRKAAHADLRTNRKNPRYEVGVVGAKLLYPSQRLQHAGVFITADAMPDHVGVGEKADTPGSNGDLQVDRTVDAVTAACMVLRRADYLAAGGMDAVRLPVAFNDVDLCLRLAQRGLDTVVMSQVQLIHRESETRSRVALTPVDERRQAIETATIRQSIARYCEFRKRNHDWPVRRQPMEEETLEA